MQDAVSRRERKKIQVKSLIVNIALRMFFEKGFAETSISEIMEAADLGIGTFYNYFDSKEDLLQYCLTQEICKAEETLNEILHWSTDATQKLSAMLIAIGNIYETNRELFRLYLQFSKNNHHAHRQPPHGPLFKEILMSVIQQGQDQLYFRKDVPGNIIAEMFMSLIYSTLTSSSAIQFPENLKYKLNLFLHGIIQ